jgi:hypothetical protein
VTITETTRGPGRPASSALELETQRLRRCTDLAVAILAELRRQGRGYESERQLREWLSASGVAFSSGDVDAALSLLAGAGLLVRANAALGQPRPGVLAELADRPAPESARTRLVRLVTEVSRPGNGRSGRPTADEIRERLHAADIDVEMSELDDVLMRMVDVGLMKRWRRSDASPICYVPSGFRPWDAFDDLGSSICRVLDQRSEIGFTSEEQLAGWLRAAGIDWDEGALPIAIGHLLRTGVLQSPRPDHWERPGEERPTWYVPPRIYSG